MYKWTDSDENLLLELEVGRNDDKEMECLVGENLGVRLGDKSYYRREGNLDDKSDQRQGDKSDQKQRDKPSTRKKSDSINTSAERANISIDTSHHSIKNSANPISTDKKFLTAMPEQLYQQLLEMVNGRSSISSSGNKREIGSMEQREKNLVAGDGGKGNDSLSERMMAWTDRDNERKENLAEENWQHRKVTDKKYIKEHNKDFERTKEGIHRVSFRENNSSIKESRSGIRACQDTKEKTQENKSNIKMDRPYDNNYRFDSGDFKDIPSCTNKPLEIFHQDQDGHLDQFDPITHGTHGDEKYLKLLYEYFERDKEEDEKMIGRLKRLLKKF